MFEFDRFHFVKRCQLDWYMYVKWPGMDEPRRTEIRAEIGVDKIQMCIVNFLNIFIEQARECVKMTTNPSGWLLLLLAFAWIQAGSSYTTAEVLGMGWGCTIVHRKCRWWNTIHHLHSCCHQLYFMWIAWTRATPLDSLAPQILRARDIHTYYSMSLYRFHFKNLTKISMRKKRISTVC